MIALADQGRTAPLTSINAITDLYNFAGTTGSSSYTTNYRNGYSAQAGYDLVTGIGSLKANNLIPTLTNA